jgi:hypothetical protein
MLSTYHTIADTAHPKALQPPQLTESSLSDICLNPGCALLTVCRLSDSYRLNSFRSRGSRRCQQSFSPTPKVGSGSGGRPSCKIAIRSLPDSIWHAILTAPDHSRHCSSQNPLRSSTTATAHRELAFGYLSEPRLRSVDRLSAFRY